MQLVDDLRLTSQVSDTYAQVLPQIGQILDNTVLTTTTLEDRSAKLNALFTNVADFPLTFAVGLSNRVELFGSFKAVTRIDRDLRPLFTSNTDVGGVLARALVHDCSERSKEGREERARGAATFLPR